MCHLTNERYKTYQTGFLFDRLGHAPGVGLGGTMGVGGSKKFFPNSTRFGVLVTYINSTCNGIYFWPRPLGPWGGAKRSNIIISQSRNQFQRFLSQTLCVFSQMKDIKHIRRDLFRHLGHAPRVRLGGTVGGWGSKNFFFPKFNQIWCVRRLHQWHMQRYTFLGPRLLGPWGGAKRSNIIKSQL